MGALVTAALPALQDLLKPPSIAVTDPTDATKTVDVPRVDKSTLGKLLPYAPLAYLLLAGPRGVLNAGPGAVNNAFVSVGLGIVGGLIADKILDKKEEPADGS